jgi:hypothetical protein
MVDEQGFLIVNREVTLARWFSFELFFFLCFCFVWTDLLPSVFFYSLLRFVLRTFWTLSTLQSLNSPVLLLFSTRKMSSVLCGALLRYSWSGFSCYHPLLWLNFGTCGTSADWEIQTTNCRDVQRRFLRLALYCWSVMTLLCGTISGLVVLFFFIFSCVGQSITVWAWVT